MPLIYAAAGDAKNATALATSSAFPKRFMGISFSISSRIASTGTFNFSLRVLTSACNLSVSVAPGKTLFTVIPNSPYSLAIVFAQLATAQRVVLLTPKFGKGCFTEVEMILMMRP